MKQARSVLLSRPVVITSLVIGVVLAAGTALLSAVSSSEISNASNRVAHTQETLLAINQLRASVIDAETGQRGYILTGLDTYLEPYTQATAHFDEQLAQLRGRLVDSKEQTVMLEQVAGLMATKVAEMSRTIELRRNSQVGPALHLIDAGTGLKTMNALRDTLYTLEERALTSLALESAAVSRRAGFFHKFSLGMLIAACALGATGAVLFMNRLHELETMITVCAWTHRVKYQGKWVSFEEYLRSRFNLSFTHGISEEAAKKLQMEAIEFVETDPAKSKVRPTLP